MGISPSAWRRPKASWHLVPSSPQDLPRQMGSISWRPLLQGDQGKKLALGWAPRVNRPHSQLLRQQIKAAALPKPSPWPCALWWLHCIPSTMRALWQSGNPQHVLTPRLSRRRGLSPASGCMKGGVTQGRWCLHLKSLAGQALLLYGGLGVLSTGGGGGMFSQGLCLSSAAGLCSAAVAGFWCWGSAVCCPAGAANGSALADAKRKGFAPAWAVGWWQGQHWDLWFPLLDLRCCKMVSACGWEHKRKGALSDELSSPNLCHPEHGQWHLMVSLMPGWWKVPAIHSSRALTDSFFGYHCMCKSLQCDFQKLWAFANSLHRGLCTELLWIYTRVIENRIWLAVSASWGC